MLTEEVAEDIKNKKALNLLHNEKEDLIKSISRAEDILVTAAEAEKEFDDQEKIIKRNQDRISEILNKVPLINKVLKSIKFHKYKEKIVLGFLIGFIIFFTFYLTT